MTGQTTSVPTTTCAVRVTTTLMSSDVGITEFQFGSVPAPSGSGTLIATSVAPGSVGYEVFVLDPDIVVPAAQTVRYNIRFELNVHNSANLQISLSPGTGGTTVEWRWSAPVGYTGVWSTTEQQAPWYDDAMDYCINIQPDGSDIMVTLSEHPGSASQGCAFIPPQHSVASMVRPS